MKQRIDVSQLKELTPEQREMLRERWRPSIGDMFAWLSPNTSSFIGPLGPIVTHVFGDGTFMAGAGTSPPQEYGKEDCFPLLSIGQCIECLRDKDADLLCYTMKKLFAGICFDPSPVMLKINEHGCKYYEPVELIDALFEAIKAVEV